MTLQRMVEELSESLPKVSRTRLIYDLNDAAYEYCQETGLIVQRTQLASTDYVGEDTIDEYFEYTLPGDVYEVLDVNSAFQGSGFEVYDGKIRFNWLPQPEVGLYPIIHYTRIPAALVDLTDEPEFEKSMHRALIAFVRAQYWLREPNTQNLGMAQQALYRDFIRRGKQMAASFRIRNIEAVPYTGGVSGGTVGNVVYGEVSLVQGINPVTFPNGHQFASTAFRVAFTPSGGIYVEEYNKETERTVSSFKVNAAAECTLEYIAAGPVSS